MGGPDGVNDLRRSLGRSFAILSSGQVVAKALAFVATIALTRGLGVERYGVVAWATTLVAYVTLAVDLGLSILGPFEVARDESVVRSLARSFVGIRAATAAPVFAVTVAIAWLAPVPRLTAGVVVLFALLLLIQPFEVDWAFLGSQRMTPSVVAEILGQVTLAAGVLALVRRPEDVLRVPILYVAARLVTVAVQLLAFRRIWRGPAGRSVERRELIRDALPLAGSSLVAMVSNNFDLLILFLLLDARAAGLYGAAYRLVWAPTILVTAYFTSIKPLMARAREESRDAAARLLAASTRITTAIGVGLVVGGVIVAKPLIVLLFGRAYAPATTAVQLLLGALGLIVVSRNFRWMLVACRRQDLDFRIMAIAAVINIAGNFALIPLVGIAGAAVASVASEASILVLAAAAAGREVGVARVARHLPLPMLCAVPMAALVWWASSWNVVARIAAGGALYLGCLVATGVIRLDEIRDILGALVPRQQSRAASETKR